MSLVEHFLCHAAALHPSKVALVCGGRRVTYAELDETSNRLAHVLRAAGATRGSRIAVYLHNSVETVLAIFAILKAGCTFVVLNRSTKLERLAVILLDCDVLALFTDDKACQQGVPLALRQQVPSLRTMIISGDAATSPALHDASLLGFVASQSGHPATPPPTSTIDLDLACLIYTSGTTGEPKGVMCSHANMVFVTDAIVSYLENTAQDVVLSVLPLSFTYGLYQLLATFRSGGTLVLEHSFAFPAEILARIPQERVTGFPGVPTIFATLLGMDLTPYDLSSLRYLTNAAAAMSPTHITELRRRLPHAAFFSMYGQTETARTLYLPPSMADQKPGSVGFAIPGTEVWIADEQGQRLPPGATGELIVRGRHVMRGYWNQPEETAKRFRPGPVPGEQVCHTGDLFRTDDEGCFYFVSRTDDIIKCRGEKVAPKEVENVLYTLKGVLHAAVVGIPDAILGEAIKAVIVVDVNTLTRAHVLAHCRAHLEDYMVPRVVEFRDALPLTTSGKIKRSELV